MIMDAVPGVEEFPMGALSFNETIIFNDSLIRALNISHSEIDKSLMREARYQLTHL